MTEYQFLYWYYNTLSELRLWQHAFIGLALREVGISQPSLVAFVALLAVVVAVFVLVLMLATILIPAGAAVGRGVGANRAAVRPRACPHGVPIGVGKRYYCARCAQESGAAAEIDQRLKVERERRGQIEQAAATLRRQEADRLRETLVPTEAELRLLPPARFADEIADMFARLGHSAKVQPAAGGFDIQLDRGGETSLVRCGGGQPVVTEAVEAFLSDLFICQPAAAMYATAGGFTPDADAFAKAAKIELLDGPLLVGLMRRGRAGATDDDRYHTLCRKCGSPAAHRLRAPESVRCPCGALVAPALNLGEDFPTS